MADTREIHQRSLLEKIAELEEKVQGLERETIDSTSDPYTQALAQLQNKREGCSGMGASWCPIHGDCICPRDADSGERDEQPDCPLCGDDSECGRPVDERAVAQGVLDKVVKQRVEIEALVEKVQGLEDGLRGMSWMFVKNALVRDTSRDNEDDYPMRSMIFGRWLASVFEFIHRAFALESAAPNAEPVDPDLPADTLEALKDDAASARDADHLAEREEG